MGKSELLQCDRHNMEGQRLSNVGSKWRSTGCRYDLFISIRLHGRARPGGMKTDMIQLLADMEIARLPRFPGGCDINRGRDLARQVPMEKTLSPY